MSENNLQNEFVGPIEPTLPEPIFEPTEVRSAPEKRGWLARHKTKILLGIAATSLAVTLATDKMSEVQEEVVESAPWVAGGIATSEALFIAGAGMMAVSAGRNIGNPFKIKERFPEIAQKAADSSLFKAGFVINTVGAVGDFAVLSTGIAKELPPQTWGMLGITLTDLAGTIAVRKVMIDTAHKYQKPEAEPITNKDKQAKPKVRLATESDLDRLASIDLSRFRKAYGENVPSKEEVKEVFSKRLSNSPEWMFVVEVDGEVEGFVSAFRTNKGIEDFVSWEESTANGTLENRVDPNGKYVYITNMTINPVAVENGGEDMLIANLFANGIAEGVEYGYFVSRMPQFKRWLGRKLRSENKDSMPESQELHQLANEYADLKKTTKKGKEVRFDYELRMYEEAGFSLEKVVNDAFSDEASMNYGVLFKADVPPHNRTLKKIKPYRHFLASSLRFIARKPNLLRKVL
jgi:hypothetical protein